MSQQTTYDYDRALQWIEAKGKGIYGSHFRLHPDDADITRKLLAYFLRDEATVSQLGITLRKGILLAGAVGVGKTALMNILRFLEKPEERFVIKTCRDISFEFIRDGFEVIQLYSRKSYRQPGHDPKTYCFDDLGTEQNLKYYGNETNVMAEVLLTRYELFISRGMITHLTTNLSATEIEAAYGNRVRSRMREMFNLVAFDETAKDKRA